MASLLTFGQEDVFAQTQAKAKARPGFDPTILRQWKEKVVLNGQATLVTGQQVVDSKRGGESTRYLDSRGRPLPEKYSLARQKQWDHVPAVEVASETRVAEAAPTRPLPASFGAGAIPSQASVVLPAPDLSLILQEDKKGGGDLKAGRRIGIRRGLAKPMVVTDKAGAIAWRELSDGSRLWNAALESTGARAVRLRFDAVQLPPGARIVVFNPDQPTEAVGPYDVSSCSANGGFWSGTVFAERVAVECVVPPGTVPGAVSFRITEVAHRYLDVFKPGAAVEKLGPCHNDVTCFPVWETVSKAVAGIGVVGSTGEILCSGSLIADSDPATTINYFLTASHCISDQDEADTSEFYWFYQTSVCDGVAPSPSSVPRTGGGCELLATMTGSQGNDFTLVRLRNDAAVPSGVTYAGWSTVDPGPNEELAAIHHPDGSNKRVTFGHLVSAGSSPDYWDVVYTSGSTEPGSSGCPLFNADQKIIGQLHGGDAACDNMSGTDTYGRFSVTYPIIERWLLNQPIIVANDDFANAEVISGTSGQLNTSNSGSSKETGEPNHAGDAGGRSIWFRWTAPGDGGFVFSTAGSSFDTLLAVYNGTSVSSLTMVASNDDGGVESPASELFFNAVTGTSYYIAVDGYYGAAGAVTLEWLPAEGNLGLNDMFANAQEVVGSYGWVASSNVGATAEPGEPDHAGNPVGRSIWFRWTAPRTQTVMFDTEDERGYVVDTVLAVYTGTAVDALTLVADNDDLDYNNDLYSSRVFFNAQQGTTYYMAVDGYEDPDLGNDNGDILLSWYQDSDVAVPPANDAFASAETISGPQGEISGSNDFATKEDGEPAIEGNAGGDSVWYRWVAPTSGLATFSTDGSRFDTLLAIYRGDAVNALTLVGASDDLSDQNLNSQTTIPVTEGDEYRIAIDGYYMQSGVVRAGPLTLSWELCADCGGNDLFANAQTLTGGSGRVFGTTVGASLETGEPAIAGNAGGKSVWFRWVAPVSGPATVDTLGSGFDTLLAVYTGTQVNALTLVNSNDDYGDYVQSRVEFTATAGTEYHFTVGGYRYTSGEISEGSVLLTWNQPNASASRLGQPVLLPDGTFRFSFTGIAGRTYEIEGSTDLQTWSKVGSVANENGTATFTDSQPVQGTRFYRTKLVP